MRKVIPLQEHIEMTDYDKGRDAVLRPESCKVVGGDGRQVWVNYWQTQRGFLVTYDSGLALSGYFSSISMAQCAYLDHAQLLRDYKIGV